MSFLPGRVVGSGVAASRSASAAFPPTPCARRAVSRQARVLLGLRPGIVRHKRIA